MKLIDFLCRGSLGSAPLNPSFTEAPLERIHLVSPRFPGSWASRLPIRIAISPAGLRGRRAAKWDLWTTKRQEICL